MSAQIHLFAEQPARVEYDEHASGAHFVRVLRIEFGDATLMLHARTDAQAAQFRAMANALNVKEPAQ